MTSDPALGLIKAIMTALREDEPVTHFVGSHIYEDQDHIHSKEPRIILGDTKTRAWQSATFDGQEHEITLHVYGPLSTREIAAAIINLLHNADLPVPGHALVDMQFEFSETRFLEKSKSYHCLMGFKAVTVTE